MADMVFVFKMSHNLCENKLEAVGLSLSAGYKHSHKQRLSGAPEPRGQKRAEAALWACTKVPFKNDKIIIKKLKNSLFVVGAFLVY